MGPNYDPPDGHDFIGINEIRRLQAHNESLEEELYFQEVMSFRSDIIRKLGQYGPSTEGFSWAYFKLRDDEDTDIATPGNPKDVLVTVQDIYDKTIEAFMPHIRIITNEIIEANEADELPDEAVAHNYFWYTEELILTPHGNIRYFTDAAAIDEETGAPDISDNRSPIFAILNGKLCITLNAGDTVPIDDIVHPSQAEEVIQPFGAFISAQDKLFALHKGRLIIDEIMDIEPAFASNKL